MRITKVAWIYLVLAGLIVVCVLAVSYRGGTRQWGDLSSLGQLVVDLLLLPAAVLGFATAADELRKSQASPIIDFWWRIPGASRSKRMVGQLPGSGGGLLFLEPLLYNEGQRIGVWYSVELEVPERLLAGPFSGTWRTQPVDGQWERLVLRDGSGGVRYRYNSRGENPCFPGQDLLLGQYSISVHATETSPTTVSLPYTIFTDWGKPVRGRLEVVVAAHGKAGPEV